MAYLKNLGKSFLYIISILFISTIVITLLNYFNVLGGKLVSIFKIITALISIFIGGFIMGKNSNQKGWLEGLKLGIVIIFILLLVSFVFLKQNWNIKNIVYYLILLVSSIFGSMVGISKKIDNK